jgi:hypothetical protein
MIVRTNGLYPVLIKTVSISSPTFCIPSDRSAATLIKKTPPYKTAPHAAGEPPMRRRRPGDNAEALVEV